MALSEARPKKARRWQFCVTAQDLLALERICAEYNLKNSVDGVRFTLHRTAGRIGQPSGLKKRSSAVAETCKEMSRRVCRGKHGGDDWRKLAKSRPMKHKSIWIRFEDFEAAAKIRDHFFFSSDSEAVRYAIRMEAEKIGAAPAEGW